MKPKPKAANPYEFIEYLQLTKRFAVVVITEQGRQNLGSYPTLLEAQTARDNALSAIRELNNQEHHINATPRRYRELEKAIL